MRRLVSEQMAVVTVGGWGGRWGRGGGRGWEGTLEDTRIGYLALIQYGGYPPDRIIFRLQLKALVCI